MISEPLGRARPDRRMQTAVRAVALSGVAVALAMTGFGARAALSAGAGAAIAAANLWLLARIVAALLPDEPGRKDPLAEPSEGPPQGVDQAGPPSRTTGAWTLVILLKMLGLFVLVGLLMRHGVVTPLPLVAGFGALPIGIAIGSIVSDRSADPRDR